MVFIVDSFKVKKLNPLVIAKGFLVYLDLNDDQAKKAEVILKENGAEEVNQIKSYLVEPKYTLEETH